MSRSAANSLIWSGSLYSSIYSVIWVALCEYVFGHLRKAKVQISLRMRAVWSGHSLFANKITGYYSVYEWTAKARIILRMRRMIWIRTFCACSKVLFHFTRSISLSYAVFSDIYRMQCFCERAPSRHSKLKRRFNVDSKTTFFLYYMLRTLKRLCFTEYYTSKRWNSFVSMSITLFQCWFDVHGRRINVDSTSFQDRWTTDVWVSSQIWDMILLLC